MAPNSITVAPPCDQPSHTPPSGAVLLVDEVQRELVFVRALRVADAALPRTAGAVQRRVQEVHASLEEQDVAVATPEEAAFTDVVGQNVIQVEHVWDGSRVLRRLVLRLSQHLGVATRLKLHNHLNFVLLTFQTHFTRIQTYQVFTVIW